jgi:hypothetical protein
MIARPARLLWLDPIKSKATQIKRCDKSIDRPNPVVFADPVLQPFREQRALTAVHALDKALHQHLPANPEEA